MRLQKTEKSFNRICMASDYYNYVSFTLVAVVCSFIEITVEKFSDL